MIETILDTLATVGVSMWGWETVGLWFFDEPERSYKRNLAGTIVGVGITIGVWFIAIVHFWELT